jgi:hypothetical protein
VAVNFNDKDVIEVTGNQLRELLRFWHSKLDVIASLFDENSYHFEEEEFVSPLSIAEEFDEAERAIAELECAQQEFNLFTSVTVQGNDMKLAEAIKRVGSVSRIAKMFKNLASGKKAERWERMREQERSKDSEYAKPTVIKQREMLEFSKYNKLASAFRTAIAEGNSKKRTMEFSVGLVDLA